MKAASLDHLWNFPIPAELETSQEWILTAMKQHGAGLVQMLWRILGCEQQVCDAYQETFLKLAHHQFNSKPENVKSYIYKTASNVAISMLRRQKVHKSCVDNILQHEKNEKSGQDFDQDGICENLRVLVARLPQHLREVVILRDFGEMSYGQVSKMLNITQATARVYRSKAIGLLAIWLKDEQKI